MKSAISRENFRTRRGKKERTDMDDIWITVLGYLTGFAMGILTLILLRTIM